MNCPKGTTRQIDRQGVVISMQDRDGARSRDGDRPLRCVSSGYMSDGGSCPNMIPASVVESAWAAELARAGGDGRLFDFPWRGRMWLAFGLPDGEVRGVYCPTHRAERDARSSGCEAQHYSPSVASA